MSLRSRVAAELGILAVLTALFLWLFPVRPTGVDVGLALFALTLIGASSRFTRDRIWSRFPPLRGRPDRRRSYALVMTVTAAAALVLLAIGAGIARRDGGGAAVEARLLSPAPLLALGLYLPWALLQQTLFQFYLLGRLRVLFPADSPAPPIVLTGMAYSLVHLPDPWLTAVTAAGGIFWTWAYHRFRVLGSIALSHAVLGSLFYHWVYGRDLWAACLRLAR
jgi:membrane protease YdiL (CAAX protease family)